MKMNIFEKNKTKNSGFTIIELMIATSVFAVVLVIAASGILAIGRLYYKGITASRTQEATRSVVNTITNTIQFTAQSRGDDGVEDKVGMPQAVCFGYDRYTYQLDSQVDDDTSGLVYDRRDDLSECTPIDLDSLGSEPEAKELIPANMSLLKFKIDAINSSNFKIMMKVGYGDHDLQELTQCSGSVVNGFCNNPSPEDVATARCRGGIAGSNFCAVSELETTINKRVE